MDDKKSKRESVILKCKHCGEDFSVFVSDSRYKRHMVFYCSKPCADKDKRTGSVKKCLFCGKEFYTTRATFCSVECSNKYGRVSVDKKEYFENGYKVKFINGILIKRKNGK